MACLEVPPLSHFSEVVRWAIWNRSDWAAFLVALISFFLSRMSPARHSVVTGARATNAFSLVPPFGPAQKCFLISGRYLSFKSPDPPNTHTHNHSLHRCSVLPRYRGTRFRSIYLQRQQRPSPSIRRTSSAAACDEANAVLAQNGCPDGDPMEIWGRKTGAEKERERVRTGDFMPIRSENPSYPASSRGKIAVKNLSRACGSIEKEKLPWACWNFTAMYVCCGTGRVGSSPAFLKSNLITISAAKPMRYREDGAGREIPS